jgi:hypothetical protein
MLVTEVAALMILKNRPSNPSQNRAVVSAPLINLLLGVNINSLIELEWLVTVNSN